MTDELNALLKNHTWPLVPSQPFQNTVRCKWVIKRKCKADGSIEHYYKACLVMKGFHQQHGFDYDHIQSHNEAHNHSFCT